MECETGHGGLHMVMTLERTLAELLRDIPDARIVGPAEVRVRGIAYDSRQVRPGDVFVPWSGGRRFGDGHRFIPDALERGAVAVVAEEGARVDAEGVPRRATLVRTRDNRLALALMAAAFYGYPGLRLRVFGVTGTKGKTTTTHMIRHLLASAGRPCGLIGTVHYLIGERRLEADRTTPQAPDVQRLLAEMVAAGCAAAVMEVASIALVQHRVAGCGFDVGVFTNLGREHLDDHGTMEEYAAAKARLFALLGQPVGGRTKPGPHLAVVNGDDPYGERMAAASRVTVVRYGTSPGVDFRAEAIEADAAGVRFVARTPAGRFPVRVPLTGRFNALNALAALAAVSAEGLDLAAAAEALATLPPVPGRFERVDLGQPFLVVVDYAHTPHSLAEVLRAARALTAGRLICVFGCGGDRDPGKRPEMGRVAAELADLVILTSDNPRSEDPEAIIDQIEAGMAASPWAARPRERLTDRAAAIRRAIELAGPGDTVLIAGKGHETYQILRDRTVPFDDREVARAALRERGYGGGETA